MISSQSVHQIRNIYEHIVVNFEKVRCGRTSLDSHVKREKRLQRQVPVGIDEVSLDDVILAGVLRCNRFVVSGGILADDEGEADVAAAVDSGLVRPEARPDRGAPGLADCASTV